MLIESVQRDLPLLQPEPSAPSWKFCASLCVRWRFAISFPVWSHFSSCPLSLLLLPAGKRMPPLIWRDWSRRWPNVIYCYLNLNIVLKEWKHLLSLLSDSEALRLTAFNNILSVSCCHLSFVQHSLVLLPLFSNLSLNCCKQAKHGLCIPKCRQSSTFQKLCTCTSTDYFCSHGWLLWTLFSPH